MAIPLPNLEAYRDELIRALASGTRRVKDQNGEEIEFRTTGETVRALRDIEARIAALKAGGAAPSKITFSPTKGA